MADDGDDGSIEPETRKLIRERSGYTIYISDSQILEEAFEPMEEDAELTERERAGVIAAYDEFHADPTSGLNHEQVLESLAKASRERVSAGQG